MKSVEDRVDNELFAQADASRLKKANMVRLSKTGQITAAPFYREIYLHAMTNVFHLQPGYSPIMVVTGEPGVGKSHQISGVLEELGIRPRILDPSDLAGEYEGTATQSFDSALANAKAALANGQLEALVLEDIHLSQVSQDRATTNFTVNAQLLVGRLMAVADELKNARHPTPPIFATSNRIRDVPAPLMRHGRCYVYEYAPTVAQTASIVATIFPELAGKEIEATVFKLGRNDISFYVEVRNQICREFAFEHWEQFVKSPVETFARVRSAISKMGHRDLISASERLSKQRRNVDHVRRAVADG